jgi:hypothetical protein
MEDKYPKNFPLYATVVASSLMGLVAGLVLALGRFGFGACPLFVIVVVSSVFVFRFTISNPMIRICGWLSFQIWLFGVMAIRMLG